MDSETFVHAIESGNYPGYYVANIDRTPTPMSKPDSKPGSNLGKGEKSCVEGQGAL